MLVKAIATGFHGKIREPGTPDGTFEVPDGSKASWYVPAGDVGKERPSPKANTMATAKANPKATNTTAPKASDSSTGPSQNDAGKNDAKQ